MARTTRHARTRTRTRNHRGAAAPRPLPWVLLADATQLLRERPLDLAPRDRARLRDLVLRAGGRGINLSLRERAELTLIVDRANVPQRTTPVPLVKQRAAAPGARR
ncbi:MAG: hypothetical protein QM679_04590 [Patulibacter sp.]